MLVTPNDGLTTANLVELTMAKAKDTADSAARLDPIPLIVMPACPQGLGAVAHVCARTTT